MKRTFITLYFLFVSLLVVQAQLDIPIKKREFKIKKTGFKDAWGNVRTGDQYFDAGIGTFPDALKHYLLAYRYNKNNPELNYKIGVCYLTTNKYSKAPEFLEMAYLANENVAEDILLMMARAYHLNLRFDKAIEYYESFYEQLTRKALKHLTIDVQKLITECRHGKELVSNPDRVIIENMGSRINTQHDDYNAVLHPNDSLLYYTSRSKDSRKDDRYKLDNKFYEEIFVARAAGELWRRGQPVEKRLNSDNHESVLAFNEDGSKIFIYNGEKRDGEILVSEYRKGKWRRLKTINRIGSGDKETSITFMPGDSVAFFVSERSKEGLGGKDIYWTHKNAKGKWEHPVNLGNVVNSIYDEEAVFWDPSTERLYFSSKGHNSMGGYDVFYTSQADDGSWTQPVNIGFPVNTPNDELFFHPIAESNQAYLSAKRDNGLGGFDIYKLIFLGEEKELLSATANNWLTWDVNQDPILFYQEPEGIKVDTSVYLAGHILDSQSQSPIVGALEVVDLEKSEVIGKAITDTSGAYKIRLPERKEYGIEITAKEYLYFVKILDVSQMPVEEGLVKKDFTLDKVAVGAKMILKNIFFQTNSSSLKSSSYTELNRVVELLKNNPGIRLEISGHTDNVGSYRANLKLSEDRAKSVVDYLVEQGIDKKRLEYKGYSFTDPIANNNTEEGRSQNRRVEFKIIGK
ncbi:MAG: OmpA family protein [Bacteroidales bacterium]